MQPLFSSLPIREICVHETLEDPAVIGCEPMDKFVDDNELAQLFRKFKQFCV